ncbi:MAG: MFS transporter, partial [Chloroflexota bacterium]|nr:MFS transporter [Chloroflexota bacterium]
WILGAIYIAVAGLAACMQFSSPASLALIGQIVSEPSRPRAMGFMQGSMSLGMLVGPALAAPLLLAFGAQWALLIDAASFAVGLATLLAMRLARSIQRAAQHERQSLGREIIEGISFTVRTRTLRVLALVMGVAMLGAGAINALDVFFTTHNLHTPLDLYGLLSTTFGIGLIIGAILTGALAQRVGLARTLWVSTALTGALLIAYARLNSFTAAAIMLLVMGIPMAGIDVAGGPLLLRETPERLVGRVSSIITPIGTVATLAGAALAGYADSAWLNGFSAHAFGMAFGPVDTIFAIGGALILVGGLYSLVGLRGADRHARLAAQAATLAVVGTTQEG